MAASAWPSPFQWRSLRASRHRDWYAGLFADCRHVDDTATRVLLSFPDQSAICLNGRSQIQYFRASSSGTAHTIPLPAINPNSTRFEEVLPADRLGASGLAGAERWHRDRVPGERSPLYDRFVSTTPIFQLTAPGATTDGVLTVGKSQCLHQCGLQRLDR